ncbi:trypsin-like peptidase domain-containing protein [Streptomyces sp. NPDC088747]|uniref:trypsin-like peptidase domain-containing protein n=1 Tax=Streptomyces sp. NPDC088747 TaxID=3365886 RepID=UPI0038234667
MAGRGPRTGRRHAPVDGTVPVDDGTPVDGGAAVDGLRAPGDTRAASGGTRGKPGGTRAKRADTWATWADARRASDDGLEIPDDGRELPDEDREIQDDSRATPDEALVRVCDLAGRPRGMGFVADHQGTVVTSHEAVDGLARLVLHAPGGRTCVVTADAVTPVPDADLALVRTEGLGVDPLPVTVRGRVETGTYVRIAAGGWREARVLGGCAVTYTATDRFHLLRDALELAIGTSGADALRLGGGAAGGPVIDVSTGAVVAVLGTALHAGHRVAGFAVPLRGPDAEGPLAALLARNASTVPAYGADLNPAGVLELTATSVGSEGPGVGSGGPDTVDCAPVERAEVARELAAFTAPHGGPAAVLGLVGPPGSGRTTELAALAERRTRSAEPAPTLWLRGADLLATDLSVAEAAARALERAGRIVAASREGTGSSAEGSGVLPPQGYGGELGDIGPERLARVARDAGRPLLLLLDGPEEMPPALAHRMPRWTAATAQWLRENGARLAIACRAEYWEQAGAEFPSELLHRAGAPAASWVPDAGAPAASWVPDVGASAASSIPDAGAPAASWVPDAGAPAAASVPDAASPVAPWAPYAAPPVSYAGVPAASSVLDAGAPAAPSVPYAGVPAASSVLDAAPPAAPSVPYAAPPAAPPVPYAAPPATYPAPPAPSARETGRSPACVRLGDLTDDEALRARIRAGIPEGVLARADARHPLTLRLLSEVRAALPDGDAGPLDRDEVFAAYLDLMCLRVAVRLAAANGLRGAAVRRMAAQVSGQVHEAARRCLGPGQGELDRAAFEAVFPWGPGRGRRLGAATGWASAVLTEGLLVPAGTGYRFAHEELADWIQGAHLDLAPALHALVHRARAAPSETPEDAREAPAPPVPRHRIGPVVQALLLLARQRYPAELARRLAELVHAMDDLLPTEPTPAGDAAWWATHLCADVLLSVPDAGPYAGVLRQLAERIGVWREQGRRVPGEFGPAFWEALALPEADRFELLRHLVVADEAPRSADRSQGLDPGRDHEGDPRYLDAVARRLAADPTAVQPHLTAWFDDDRPLPATPHATVATAAQALLYAHRRRALDDLAEALVGVAHRRADELLAVLAEEEPSAVCRAVDRWAHDERPAWRVAAVAYGLRAAPHVRTEADRALLRYAALALLARPADSTLHGGALGLLVRDPWTRARHLPGALERFTAGDPQLPASAPAAALTTHPDQVLAAFRTRLCQSGSGTGTGRDTGSDSDSDLDSDTYETLRTLVDVTTPALARRVAVLVREVVELRPATAPHVAAYVDRRLEQGPEARPVLFPLVTGLLYGCPAPARSSLATVLAAPGGPASRPLRRELLDLVLTHERDPAVLETLLRAAARGAARGGEGPTRELVHRTGLLLARTPAGATVLDHGLVELARAVPGFATLVARWLAEAPEEWSGVVGPSTRRMIENLAGAPVPA